ALGQAHRHGIVHRDLKPGNVMLARAGGAIHAKLLDFGVAKLLSQPSATTDIGASGLTVSGVIIGTPRYMAPEQLEARAVDHRADIFAFGAMLFEMLVGRPAFEGQSTASIVAAVLTHHPATVSTVRVGIPPTLDRVVKKCLSKNPDERWQSADDLASELKWIAESDPTSVSQSARPARRSALWWMLATTGMAAVAVLGTWLATRADPPARYRLTLVPPEGSTLVPGQPAVVSPDGRQVALVITEASGITRLYVRNLATAEIRAVEGTDQPTWPFWSPDARSLGFFADGKLKTIDVATGTVRTIADAPLGRGASWSRDDIIVFSAFNQDRLYRMSAFGGEKAPVTTIDAAHEFAHMFPEFLPDGRHFLYRVQSGDESIAGVYIGSLDGTIRRRLVATNGHAVFAAPGYLVFNRDTTVLAQAFDTTDLELDGDPFVVTSAAPVFLGRSLLSASTNGLLVTTSAPIELSLAWYDRAGREVAELGEYSNNPHTPELSPDGTRVLMSMQRDLWLIDAAGGAPSRITFDGADDEFGHWWPDGRSIVWASN
ncbi:MAG: protein kinase domain-containing protein, partial [Gammaproteobacteria bacterium]